jgi:hypothetical protein
MKIVMALALAGLMTTAAPRAAQAQIAEGQVVEGNTVEFSPVSPFIRIYVVQFARRLGDRNELLLGGGYTNIEYDNGQSHAPTLILGYRHYFWRKAHIEYQLWPSYNWYYENNEDRYYEGAELWNEFRPGYTFDFHLGTTPFFLNVQYLIGWGLYGDESKPQSWKDQVEEDGALFTAPMIFMGWRF